MVLPLRRYVPYNSLGSIEQNSHAQCKTSSCAARAAEGAPRCPDRGRRERKDLADFREHHDLQSRHGIALKVIADEARHWAGVERADKDPEEHVERHT